MKSRKISAKLKAKFKKVKLEKDELIAKLDKVNNHGVIFCWQRRKVQGKIILFCCQWQSKPEFQREGLICKIKGKKVMPIVRSDKNQLYLYCWWNIVKVALW